MSLLSRRFAGLQNRLRPGQCARAHSRGILSACTVYHDSLSEALTRAIGEASAPHHGFISSDMPSHALILISRHYFPELSASNLGQGLHGTMTKTLGDENIETISAVVDEIHESTCGMKGVSILLASEDEGASVHVFEDSVNREISLGRAWKSQGVANNEERMDAQWVPPSGDWKSLLSRGSTSPSQTNNVTSDASVSTAIILSKPDFSAIDWPAQSFPHADKYGLVPSTTPFLTGLPITLTHNNRVLKNGGIALALKQRLRETRIMHPGLKVLGDTIAVTKAQGNILITLDNQPATYALLERIRAVLHKDLKISKDIQLFGQILQHKADSDGPKPLIKIIAGDPGKGSIALSGGFRVAEGDSIQLFYEDPDAEKQIPLATPTTLGSTMIFSTIAADSEDGYRGDDNAAGGPQTPASISDNTFSGGSCSGMIVGGPSRTWVHESVGSTAILR